ncbi:MAG: hypothetical protein LBK18_08840 [Prevotellaceae bacterium]|jgi:hypothetical protein|nr:hypothetical protein [Prevotellaceae bacterium]
MQTANPYLEAYLEEMRLIQEAMMDKLHLSYAEAASVAIQHIKNMNINEMFEFAVEQLDTIIELLEKNNDVKC